jgi:hypothetical protein
MSVECEITWIFKRYRKDILSSDGILEVTMTRFLLPTQTCVWWKRLTDLEKTVVTNNLKYKQTWSNVLSIKLICSNNIQIYRLHFLLPRDEDGHNIVAHAPQWATWAQRRADWVSFHLPNVLALQCRTRNSEETDIIF